MYNNLYGYGCSHMVGTTHSGISDSFLTYTANSLNITNIFNRGENSSGNTFNRVNLLNDYLNNNIKKNSLIIFQLTQYHRKTYQFVHKSDIENFSDLSLITRWGTVDGIVHMLSGKFNNDGSFDSSLDNYVDTYYKRLSGEEFIMFDDILTIYSVLNLISSQIKNVKFLIISWPEIKSPFEKYIPLELSNIWEWSLKNELTEHHLKNNGDYHLSELGHKLLSEKILKFLN